MKIVRWFGLAMACLASFLGSPAVAANWIYVTTSDSGTVAYYDLDSIRREGTDVTVWEKLDLSQVKSTKIRERKSLSRYDCLGRTYTLISSVSYFGDGTTRAFDFKPYEQEEGNITPESIGEAQMQAVCRAQ